MRISSLPKTLTLQLRRRRPRRKDGVLAERRVEQALAISRDGDAEVPRQRPRRRRRLSATSTNQASTAADGVRLERVPEPTRSWWKPTAGVVTALGLGIWAGWTFTIAGGVAEDVALWIGVLMAGLGGGRLFRRSFQARRARRR